MPLKLPGEGEEWLLRAAIGSPRRRPARNRRVHRIAAPPEMTLTGYMQRIKNRCGRSVRRRTDMAPVQDHAVPTF
jgi:hypothetical protein